MRTAICRLSRRGRSAITSTIQFGYAPSEVASSPDGAYAYLANEGPGNCRQLEPVITTTDSHDHEPMHIVVRPDGKRIYITNHVDFTVSVIRR